ncbi:MAG: beta-L-arabinofuranosidase domain-containing protein [Mangrovibacterium sp.]
MKTVKLKAGLIAGLFMFCGAALAQDKLYRNEFPPASVKLLDGPFKHAGDVNIRVLLSYDVDHLLAPYRKEAGLPEKAKGFSNWEGLDGHVGGHYLTAVAQNYAVTGNAECKKRMDYILSELKACQEANAINNPEWGTGYAGGMPNSAAIWSKLQKGDFSVYNASWVPWYNVHKMYAGLRDAWAYTGNEEARDIFLKFCDWGIHITSALTDEQMQSMLATEHGGMNEVFADAYYMTGDDKYLVAAKRFSHNILLDAMAAHIDNLDNKHANTQVPKAVGFQRIAELSHDKKYADAGSFFWETVTRNRTLAFGGNSRREFFPGVASCEDFVNDVEGPESCNTYNMLKLTEGLFRVHPLAKYIDFYERAMYNHILSSQHPGHGGYVYFTPARPRHYRVYSSPNQAMWCCVGSGMENHGKYNHLIYTHHEDSLFLNLFIASELTWMEKGLKLTQETQFPYEEQTVLKIKEISSPVNLIIRYPSWVKSNALKVLVNGKETKYKMLPSGYITPGRRLKAGDEIRLLLPMANSVEQLPNVPDYIAVMHGPILLGAKTGTEDLSGLVANDSRWGHIAHGKRLPVDQAPIIIEDDISKIAEKLEPVEGKPLTFSASKIKMVNPVNAVFEPFYKIHDARYMIYWMALSPAQYRHYLDSVAVLEKHKLELQSRTIDFVAPGEQQPEADHLIQKENSGTGTNMDKFYRDAREGGFFSYQMAANSETGLSLIVRYWGAEWGGRKFDIYIDDEKLLTEDNTGRWNQSKFLEVEYAIPDSMVKGKENIRVKFQSLQRNTAGPVYYIRLVRKK